MNDTARFWSKVDQHEPNECWPWLGAHKPSGYGNYYADPRRGVIPAHRRAYELAVGPIPDGLTIDHVASRGCVRKDCCNPAHLEPVTMGENTHRAPTSMATIHAAKDRCPRGHVYDKCIIKTRSRRCSTCDNERSEQRRKDRSE